MNPLRRERVWALFDQAVEMAPGARGAFLDDACGNDAGLRAEVESLLAHDSGVSEGEDKDAFLKSPLLRPPQVPAADPRADGSAGQQAPARRIGHYRILRELGSGGMGSVYEAEQDNPRRAVALKVIRAGFASAGLVKRFTHEAQILGRLHHPGIAQIYEAGLTEEGEPFFAMELIRGTCLDRYVRDHSLDLDARLGLFAKVCDAVQHAHDKGVIHRDLKPANILVDDTGAPRVLDFGVARATEADLVTGAGLTRTGQLLGTPNYMSPEQVTADPAAIDHRADVYALGVVLFELLAHRLPYQLDNRPLAEATRLILEQDPPQLGSVNPELRGDVETIVAKALEKDPARRYRSAADLAADLRRALNHEPILARPPSALYHLRKFARRHSALVGGVAATVAALVLGLVGTILFAVAEARQRRQAEDEKREAKFQEYRARMAAAIGALAAHDVADAARQLDAAPDHLRDWEWRHVHSRLDDASGVIPLPAEAFGFLLAAPDRLRVGVLTDDGLRLTDLEGGEPRTLPIDPEHQLSVSVAQTRRGLRVAAWVGNTTFDLLDEAGQVLRRVEIPEAKGPAPVVVSADGMRLACSRVDGEWQRLSVFDARSGKQIAVCDGHRGLIWAYAFSPDGTRLASGGEDRTARLWDAATGALLATCREHVSKVLSTAFSPDGARFLTTSSDGTVRQWDSTTGREIEAPYERHTGEVAAAVYSPDGQWVASAGSDRTVRAWRATGRQDVAILHGHTGAVNGVAFVPDRRRLVSLSGNSYLGWTGDGSVRVWEMDPGATLPVLRGHTSYVYPVAFSPDGRWIASGGWDSTLPLRLWDALTGELCATLRVRGTVRALAFGPDSSWLVSASDLTNQLQVWDVATGERRKEFQVPGGVVLAITMSPAGTRLAAVTRDGILSVLESATGREITSWRVDGGWLEKKALAYSPDGRWLAGTGQDKDSIDLWDAQTHQRTAQLKGHTAAVYFVAFSPDGRRLVSASSDRTVRIWNVATEECVAVLKGHTDEVFAAVFHPDGKRLASAGRDRAIWLWDLEKGQEVARLQGHTNYVFSLAFSPDGRSLVSGSGDASVRLWDTEPLRVRYQARRAAEALRPEAERLAERLFGQKKDAAEVVAALRADRSLSEPQRDAASRAVLRRCTMRAEREVRGD
jgi:WD40 repeat protein